MNRVPRTFNRLVPSAGIRRLTISYLMPTMKVELLKKFHPRNVPDLPVMYLLSLACILVILPLRHSNPLCHSERSEESPFSERGRCKKRLHVSYSTEEILSREFPESNAFLQDLYGIPGTRSLWVRFGQRPTSLENGLGNFLGVAFSLI